MVLEACFKPRLTEPNTNQDLFAHAESLLGHAVIQRSTSLRSRGQISSVYQQQRLKNSGSWSLSSPTCDGHKWQESTCCKQVNNTKRASATGLWERPFSFGLCTFIRECGWACESLLWISERSRWRPTFTTMLSVLTCPPTAPLTWGLLLQLWGLRFQCKL